MASTHPAPMKPEMMPAPQFAPDQHMNAARVEIKAGDATPTHRHDAECIVVVLQGSCRFYIDGQALTVNQNETLRIPAHVDHYAEALADTLALNIFSAENGARWKAAPYHDPDQDLWGV
jgi:quercetin dioxygenase-like cupin family protein